MNECISCQQLIESISEYVDGTLDDTLCAELERHLQDCSNCRIVVDTMRKTIELYRRATPDTNLPVDVRSRLYTCLNLQDYLKE